MLASCADDGTKTGDQGLSEERNSSQVTPSVTSPTLVLELLSNVFS